MERRPCAVVIKITPEAGTVKTGKVRVVPIHADIASDVLAYADAVRTTHRSAALLFCTQPRADSPKGYRGPAVKARERLAAWVHAWRHDGAVLRHATSANGGRRGGRSSPVCLQGIQAFHLRLQQATKAPSEITNPGMPTPATATGTAAGGATSKVKLSSCHANWPAFALI